MRDDEEEEVSPSSKAPPSRRINITITNSQDRVLRYRIKHDTTLLRLMVDYARRLGVDHTTIRFTYDGRRVKETSTPEDLEMEDGAEIDAWAEQEGGCGTSTSSICAYLV